MKRAKILTWGFSGVKCCLPSELNDFDIKNGKIWRGEHKTSSYVEFDGLKNKTIKIDDIYSWSNVTRFFYKDYCCIIGQENIEIYE